jgi:hypothetical protein
MFDGTLSSKFEHIVENISKERKNKYFMSNNIMIRIDFDFVL